MENAGGTIKNNMLFREPMLKKLRTIHLFKINKTVLVKIKVTCFYV